MDVAGFVDLLDRLAAAWAAPDPVAAADCFTDDAVYMEPPDRQLFVGREQLLAYFWPLEPGTYLRFHARAFDEAGQVGFAEWTFGMDGKDVADTGVAVVEVRDGRIATWREYHVKGPADWDRFRSTEGKEWQWHIGNYP
ncbi:MAG: nuclear transport factor 2 family protein [Acidimicrobiia bacterium]|nr:nuclear transport factor 2 family protein [Acidimicrobiia bacterium]